MRKVITAAFVSLDGVMQSPGSPEEDPTGGFQFGGWIVPYIDDVVGKAIDDLFMAPFDLLLGRKTYLGFFVVGFILMLWVPSDSHHADVSEHPPAHT